MAVSRPYTPATLWTSMVPHQYRCLATHLLCLILKHVAAAGKKETVSAALAHARCCVH